MKLLWMFLALSSAQEEIDVASAPAADSAPAVDAGEVAYNYDDSYNYIDGIDAKRKSQAEKDAAKAAKQKAKYAKTTTTVVYTTTPYPTTTEIPTTTVIPTTTEVPTTTADPYTTAPTTTAVPSTTATDGYTTAPTTTAAPMPTTTDGYGSTDASTAQNPYAGTGDDTYGDGNDQNGNDNNNDQYGANGNDNADPYAPPVGASDLSCFTCHGQTVEECEASGSVMPCLENEESCELEIRTRLNQETGEYDQIGVTTGCKQLEACQNNQRQNFVEKDKDLTQCRPETDKGYTHSVCRQCCWEEDCVGDAGNFWDPQTRWQWGQENGRYGINK